MTFPEVLNFSDVTIKMFIVTTFVIDELLLNIGLCVIVFTLNFSCLAQLVRQLTVFPEAKEDFHSDAMTFDSPHNDALKVV
jgi:hypothetical protein